MGRPRFFVEGRRATGERVPFAGGDAHKLLHVLRARAGERIEVIDSAAQRFDAVAEIDGDRVYARLGEPAPAPEHRGPRVTLAQGIPKGSKMDFIVEKGTELGVWAIAPFESERSVVSGIGSAKMDRWRRLAKTAALQCGSAREPEILAPCNFDALLERFAEFDRVIVPWELAPEEPLRERLPELIASAGSVLVVIGPEGGFSHAEAERAQARGAAIVHLGERILRTETAGLVLLAQIAYVAG